MGLEENTRECAKRDAEERKSTNRKCSDSIKASAQRRRSDVELLEGTRQEHKRARRARRGGGEKNYKSERLKEHESEGAKGSYAGPK